MDTSIVGIQGQPAADAAVQSSKQPAAAKKPFHEVVAENLIEQLKKGTAPWQKPWSPGPAGSGMPMNPVTGKRYKGINALQLLMQGHSDQRWMTYKQAAAEGAQVRKGEKGTPIQYWQFRDERIKKDEGGKPVLDAKGEPVKVSIELERPKVFFATVFNAEQIDGLPPLVRQEQTWNAVERAERILEASGARIINVPGDRAFYRPSTDAITMPEKGQFSSADRYYATGLHELAHWTGHPSRLDRDLTGPFGSESYAKEELRAEIASLILGDEIGIGHDPAQHVAYVGSWIKVLQNDPLEIFRAAADAEKIQTHILGLEQVLIEQLAAEQAHQQTNPLDDSRERVEDLEKAEILQVLRDSHQRANPGYSSLESWENLEKTAKANGLEAVLRWSNGDEYDPDIRVDYRDQGGQALPIHTEMYSGDGKAVSFLDGHRVPGTGLTSDNDWQTEALNSAIATMQHRASEKHSQSADFAQEQGTMAADIPERQKIAEQWVLDNITDGIKSALPRMKEERIDIVWNVLDSMAPLNTGNEFWQRHPDSAEKMLENIDNYESLISEIKDALNERSEKLQPLVSSEILLAGMYLREYREKVEAGDLQPAETHKGEKLQPALNVIIGKTLPLPDTWTGELQIRGCAMDGGGAVEEVSSEKAEFFGVYASEASGPKMWVADFEKENLAIEFAEKLKLVDAYGQTSDSERYKRFESIRQERAEQIVPVPGDVLAAKKQDVESVLNDPELQRRVAEFEKEKGSTAKSAIAQEKTWLVVPFSEREEAKRVAGKLANGTKAIDFDGKSKCWYAMPGADLEKLKRWMPENNPVRQEKPMSARDEFAEAMREAGLLVQGDHPIMDGKRHRVPVEGAKGKKADGMYVVHDIQEGEKGIPAGFIANNRTGVEFKWKSKGYALSETDKASMLAESAATQARREAAKVARQAEVSKAVGQLLAVASPAPASHTYLKNKEARPGDLKVVPLDATRLPEGSLILIGKTAKESKALREAHEDKLVFTAGDLLLTAQNINGEVQSVQSIRSNGTKMFVKDGVKTEGFHVVGGEGLKSLESVPVIVIGEGYATADTISQSLGYPTVAAFDSGNLPHVAKAIHEKFPEKPIVIAGDNDLHQVLVDGKNPGRTKAEEAAKLVGGEAVFPVFAPGEQSYPAHIEPIDPVKAKQNSLSPEQNEALNAMKKHTDFNDLATRSVLGREGLERQIKAATGLALKKHQAHTETMALSQSRDLESKIKIDEPRRAVTR